MKLQIPKTCFESQPHNSGIDSLPPRKVGVLLFLTTLVLCFAGCGGGSGNGGGGTPQASTVTVNFDAANPPTAVAAQADTGTFAAVSLQNGQLTFSVAPGVSKYAFVYQCGLPADPPGEGVSFSTEYVIEATTHDSTSVMADCSGAVTFGSPAASAPGMVTGNVDATAFTNVTSVRIFGKQGSVAGIFTQGPFAVSLPSGTQDIVFMGSGDGGTHAVKILRGQTVPGAVNSGNTVTFGPEDQTPLLGLAFHNVPAGNNLFAPQPIIEFNTANGTRFAMDTIPSPDFYPTVPPAAVQSGDYYAYGGVASTQNGSSGVQSVGFLQAVENGGSGFTIDLPDVWFSSNPTSVGPPIVFTFDYPGFSGIPVKMEKAQISWTPDSHLIKTITVIASANFLNGGNTVTIPDLSMAGQTFFGCCQTLSGVSAAATILVANFPVTTFPAALPPSQPTSPDAVFNTTVPPGGFIGFVETETGFVP